MENVPSVPGPPATDQNGKTTTYAYDTADRLTSVTDPASNVTTYAYDTENNLLSITDANSHTTTFAYDAFGRVVQTTFPSNLSEFYAYDAINNLVSKTDRNANTIQYVYDALNRLTQKNYPDSSTAAYVYDLAGKVTQMNDPSGTYGFSYDNMGRLTGTTASYSFLTGTTFTNAYTYDAASNRTGYTAPDGSTNTYTYDTLNRLTGLANSWAGSFGFSYDALSRRTQMTRPNGVNTNYTYDSLSRLLSVLHQAGGSTIDGASYTVDATGYRTSKADQLAGMTSNYSYDSIYELTQVTQAANQTESYTFDPVGNRLSSLTAATSSYNSSNQLTSNSNATYTYDANGNALTKTDSTGTTSYTWDFENRLKNVTLPGTGGTVTFMYDPSGRRVQKIFTQGTSTTTTTFAYDGQRIAETTDGAGNLVARYLQGREIDEPLALNQNGSISFYEADGLGSITSVTNSAGAVVQSYSYDTFGNLVASTGSLANPFRYAAREIDSETGLYYYRARYYDPALGRFISEDPLGFRGSGPNFYAYVFDSPTNLVDPFGLTPGDWWDPRSYDFSHYNAWDTVQDFGNVAEAFTDAITFGSASRLNDALGAGKFVNRCGIGHKLGTAAGYIAAIPLGKAAFGTRGPIFGTRYGGNTPLLNSNDFLRIGWSYSRPTGEYVFRIGGDLVGLIMDNPHIDLWPPSWWF